MEQNDRQQPTASTREDEPHALPLATAEAASETIARGTPIAKISTVNLLTSPTEELLIDKVNEIIDRINDGLGCWDSAIFDSDVDVFDPDLKESPPCR